MVSSGITYALERCGGPLIPGPIPTQSAPFIALISRCLAFRKKKRGQALVQGKAESA